MIIRKPPKKTLVDRFGYREYLGEGDYNKPEYAAAVDISFARIDRSPQYVASTTGKQLLGNAKVFCYNGLTEPLKAFKEQDVLVFDGVEHTITSATFYKEPYADKIYSYELVVV